MDKLKELIGQAYQSFIGSIITVLVVNEIDKLTKREVGFMLIGLVIGLYAGM